MARSRPIAIRQAGPLRRPKNWGKLMKSITARMLAATLTLSLSGCGGESSGGESPTPPPITTPIPTPAPTPATNYVTPDFQTDFKLSSSLGFSWTIDENSRFVSAYRFAPESRAYLDYFASPQAVNFLHENASVSFADADRIGSDPLSFQKTSDAMSFLIYNHMPKQYVAVATWKARRAQANAVLAEHFWTALFGTPSASTDPLPDFLVYGGGAFLVGGAFGSNYEPGKYSAGDQAVSWSYTPSTDMLWGSIPFVVVRDGGQRQDGLLRADGKFDPTTNSIRGALNDPAAGLHGTFRGQMFGPNRANLAIVFEFARGSDGAKFFGYYLGARGFGDDGI